MSVKIWMAIGSAAAILVIVVGCGHSHFWSKKNTAESRRAWVVKRISDRLDLDSRQQAELDRLAKELAAKHDQVRASREEARRQVLAMVRSDHVDRAELERLVEQKKARIEEMIPFFLDRALALHTMLTPGAAGSAGRGDGKTPRPSPRVLAAVVGQQVRFDIFVGLNQSESTARIRRAVR